ncbi:hypothetical protein D3C81_1645690 [compost metagenome]
MRQAILTTLGQIEAVDVAEQVAVGVAVGPMRAAGQALPAAVLAPIEGVHRPLLDAGRHWHDRLPLVLGLLRRWSGCRNCAAGRMVSYNAGHGVTEAYALVIRHKVDGIATGATAEAIVHALVRHDGEGGGLFLVERAAGDIFAASLGELDVLGDRGDYV